MRTLDLTAEEIAFLLQKCVTSARDDLSELKAIRKTISDMPDLTAFLQKEVRLATTLAEKLS